ncbi:hypothetical protein BWQ96_02817 [Gracilariopsis chorda]|uniref:Uncharacterized protein n=1 Tax=Gracilariopsis chorda TaxID=448386 RepID=A0A2V3IZ99_9FLOR|nr:hypothetical protein BWQ96_02817 [Gracilariopsis chorda]|eukprot:PXF47486.1 hypothetical protein BWQ96_02817 [Gracilariopsis chorda]
MLVMLEMWNSKELELAMLLDEAPYYQHEPTQSVGEPWRATGYLAKASRDIDLAGYAWLFVVFNSDPLRSWGQKRVKVTSGGEILRKRAHAGLWTGEYESLRYEIIARQVYRNIVGRDSIEDYQVVVDARVQIDPPDSESLSVQQKQRSEDNRNPEQGVNPRENSSLVEKEQNEPFVQLARSKTASDKSCGHSRPSEPECAISHRGDQSPVSPDSESRTRQFQGTDTKPCPKAASPNEVGSPYRIGAMGPGSEQLGPHQVLGHPEPQFRSRRDLYGEVNLTPKRRHGAVISYVDQERYTESWFVDDHFTYMNRFQFLLTEFQRRPFVAQILSRLGFLDGYVLRIDEALHPHLLKVIHAFEGMEKIAKNGRYG